MKNLKLLNKKYLSIILFFLFFGFATESQEAIDIWNVEEKKIKEKIIATENTEKKVCLKMLFMRCNLKK